MMGPKEKSLNFQFSTALIKRKTFIDWGVVFLKISFVEKMMDKSQKAMVVWSSCQSDFRRRYNCLPTWELAISPQVMIHQVLILTPGSQELGTCDYFNFFKMKNAFFFYN